MKKALLAACVVMTSSLFAGTDVLVFAGSTRDGSYNKKLALESAAIAKEMGAKVTVIDLKDYSMPFYNADLEKNEGMPKNAKRFRNAMISNQVIIIAAPEYNASIPALLKNVLDWASRSEEGAYSQEAFKGKKFVIMSASPGRGGGAKGLVHLRAIIEVLGGEVIEKQVTIPQAYEKGALDSPQVKKQLQEQLTQALVVEVDSK